MSAWLRHGACVLFGLSLGCGGGSQAPTAPVAPTVEEWPEPAPVPPGAVDVKSALASAEGARIQVRAYLVAVTLPCPACNVGERTGAQPAPKIGKSPRPRPRDMPGCLPCPSPAATLGDEAPGTSATPSAPLRAVGVAEGLQARHVGQPFVLTGTFHAGGPTGPQLDVTDVRAIGGR